MSNELFCAIEYFWSNKYIIILVLKLSWLLTDVSSATLTGADVQRVTFFIFASGCVSAAVFFPPPPQILDYDR